MLQLGNRKLARSVGIFSLPRATCKELCSYCYARNYSKWPTVAMHHASNWLQSLLPGFVQDICSEIEQLGISKVRIHEVGDFYSQTYANKWKHIANSMPEVTFLAYTRDKRWAWDIWPDNVVMYQSIGLGEKPGIGHKNLHAIIVPGYLEHPTGYKLCEPPSAHSSPYCGSSCNYCWSGTGPVAFIKH